MAFHKKIINIGKGFLEDVGDAASGFISPVTDRINQVADFVSPVFDNFTAYGLIASWLRRRLKQPPNTSPVTLNTRGQTNAAIPLIYGEIKTGGQFVTLQVRDSSKILGGAFIVCSGEIDGMSDIIIDDKPINHADYSGGSIFDYTIFTGTAGQLADTNLQLFTDYDSNFRFNEIAYVSSINTFRREAGSVKGIPKIKVTVRGKKVYDPRTTLTTYSNNPALCALNFLTNNIYGYGYSLSDINITQVIASANLCDTIVGGKKLFELNGKFLPADKDKDKILDEILVSFRASVKMDGNGLIEFQSNIDRASSFTFDESNVISHSIARIADSEIYNSAEVSWVDSVGDRDIAFYTNPTFLTEDDSVEKVVKLSLPTHNEYVRAMDLGEFIVRQSRAGLIVNLVCQPVAFLTTIHDVVSLTLSEYGFNSRLFRVSELSLSDNLTVKVTLVEHDPSAYLLSVHAPNYTAPVVTLPDSRDITDVAGLAITPQTYFGQFSESIGQLLVAWSAPTLGLVDNYEIEYKLNGDPTWIASGVTAATDWIINNVAVGSFDVRVRAVNIARYTSGWAEVLATNYVAPIADNNSVPNISGLALKYGGTVFKGRAPSFTWDAVNASGGVMTGSNSIQGEQPMMYRVEVLAPLYWLLN